MAKTVLLHCHLLLFFLLPAGNPVFSHVINATYYLTVTDANQCTSLSEDDITVTVTPPAGFDYMNHSVQRRGTVTVMR